MTPPYSIKEAASVSGLSERYLRRLRSTLPAIFSQHEERGQANRILISEELVQVLKGVKGLKDKGKTLHEITASIAGEGMEVYDLNDAGLAKLMVKLKDTMVKLKGSKSNFSAYSRGKKSLSNHGQTVGQTGQTDGQTMVKPGKLEGNPEELGQGFMALNKDIFGLTNVEFQPWQTDGQTGQTNGQTKTDDSKLERQLRQEVLFLHNEVQFLKETLRRTEERFDRLLPAAREWGSPQLQIQKKGWKYILLESIATGLIALAAGTILLLLSQQILFAP